MLRYEQNQDRNFITRYLHSFRYKNLIAEVRALPEPIKVLDIGCGPGKAFEILSNQYNIDYLGIDISEEFIAEARSRYPSAKFKRANAADYKPDESFDLVIALETLEHIPENAVVRILENVAQNIRPKLFLASVPIEVGPSVAIKYLGSAAMGYNRTSGSLFQVMRAATYQLDAIPRHETGHLGFDWRWLAQTIRHNLDLDRCVSMPWSWLPKWLAPSIIFIAKAPMK